MIRSLAKQVVRRGTERDMMIATAESCTGGLIAASITEIAGSSAVLDRGFVTYSNEAKTQMLGVPAELITTMGAVSQEVAEAMVAGALQNSRAEIAVAVTGIAGPDGGTAEKPVGLVYIAAQSKGNPVQVNKCHFSSFSRSRVRSDTVKTALEMILWQMG